MKVIFAKHRDNPKEFLFRMDDNDTGEKGYMLLVETMRGEAFVEATTDPCIVDGDNEVLIRAGAYFPLKRVLASCPKSLYDRITRNERNRIVSVLQADDLPF